MQDNDFELIKKFLEGDEVAFNLIVRKYQKKIYWHARQMLGNHLDADEVTQEVLIVLYKKLKDFNFQSSLYTWIYKIVSTRSLNQIRKKKVKNFFSMDDSENQFEAEDPKDIVADIVNREKLDLVNKALQKIPPKQREIFIMRNYEQQSYEEISKITGKSIGGLKANYFHALKKILELTNEKK
ncbi:MAG: RNA polymerase sigma factor [Ignavibacteriae bacterium HGW-Ignavibacteriae-3]|nr:MAG: RNA polymerase sigma factor [Ignavibacteriae bacterium HGW-Ignavibacteriae-3]